MQDKISVTGLTIKGSDKSLLIQIILLGIF
jgi:hypothetical protein